MGRAIRPHRSVFGFAAGLPIHLPSRSCLKPLPAGSKRFWQASICWPPRWREGDRPALALAAREQVAESTTTTPVGIFRKVLLEHVEQTWDRALTVLF